MPKIHFYKNDGMNSTVSHLLENIQELCKETYDMEQMKRIIRKTYGFKFLGSGVTAMVFQISKTKIIRIERDFNKNGFFKWMKYCLKNQHLKTVPKISLSCTIQGTISYPNYFITINELLIPLHGSNVFKKIDNSEVLWGYFEPKASSYGSHQEIFDAFTQNLKNGFKGLFKPEEYAYIRRTFRKINDLHSGNMMLSPNKKRLIFTDPIN